MTHAIAYPQGVEFGFVSRVSPSARLTEGEYPEGGWPGDPPLAARAPLSNSWFRFSEIPTDVLPRLLKIGIRLADGRSASLLPQNLTFGRAARGGVALETTGGWSSGAAIEYGLWLSPLPPAGPLVFGVEWPEYEIPLSTHEVDAAIFRDAAAAAEELWPSADDLRLDPPFT